MPSAAGGVFFIVFAVVGGVIWISVTSAAASQFHGPPKIFPLFGFVFIGFGIFGGLVQISKARALERARARYRARRDKLLRESE